MRELDRNNKKEIHLRKENVEKRQKNIVEAWKNKDSREVNRLQISRIRSLDCRTLAVTIVHTNNGGKTPGIDGETWETDADKIKAIEWLGEVITTWRKMGLEDERRCGEIPTYSNPMRISDL